MSICLIAALSMLVGVTTGMVGVIPWSPIIGALSMAGIAVVALRTEDRLRNVYRDLAYSARAEADAVRRDADLAHDRVHHVEYVLRRMCDASMDKLHVEYARGWRYACATIARALGL